MKNFILAITSFIMAVLFFSQIALAQTEENFGFVQRAPGTIAEGESGDDRLGRSETPQAAESNNPEAFDAKPCDGCRKHDWNHKYMQNYTTVKPAKPGTTTPNGSAPAEGRN